LVALASSSGGVNLLNSVALFWLQPETKIKIKKQMGKHNHTFKYLPLSRSAIKVWAGASSVKQ
jgi:hypothetical protein